MGKQRERERASNTERNGYAAGVILFDSVLILKTGSDE
jgi:hypothetical protein